MITFKDIQQGLNSSRLVMLSYIIQAVKASVGNEIKFSKKAYQFVTHDENGNVQYLAPKTLFMFDGSGVPSMSHCVLRYALNGSEDQMYVHDMSADDLFSLCEMVYKITKDKLPVVTEQQEKTIDLVEGKDFIFIEDKCLN